MSGLLLPPELNKIAAHCGKKWPAMAKASAEAEAERDRLTTSLSAANLVPTDTSIVVFGSLARGEWTAGSDLDWTLLVDGPVMAGHADVVQRIAAKVQEQKRDPGPTGIFGHFMFSHEIVHFIGGDDDTNTNTTRRLLLLLESKSLTSDGVRERVLRALLARYVGEDLRYHAPDRFFVPRFLLNDYVRYWRTMAVDSAQKRRDRVAKWALRNIKLRLSRKLLFATGLWACLSCKLHPSEELETSREERDSDGVGADMTAFLMRFTRQPPLETLAEAFLKYEAWDAAETSFDAYEAFLELLDDQDHRAHLEALTVEDAMTDEIFARAKRAANGFQAGLTRLFFGTNLDLTTAAQTDGVF